MGMFDTIIFDCPIPCPKCGAEIRSDQTKAFECTLDEYRIGDCIAQAEEIRIVGDELYSGACKALTTRNYLVIHRGVLVGIAQEREAAEALVRGFNAHLSRHRSCLELAVDRCRRGGIGAGIRLDRPAPPDCRPRVTIACAAARMSPRAGCTVRLHRPVCCVRGRARRICEHARHARRGVLSFRRPPL